MTYSCCAPSPASRPSTAGRPTFSNRESAQQYIDEAGWSDREVGELTPLQLLHWMVKVHEDGTDFVAVNPNRPGQLAGKPQEVITIEEKLRQVVTSLSAALHPTDGAGG